MAVRRYMRTDYLSVERDRTSIFQNGSFTTQIEKCTFMKIMRLNTVKSRIPIEAQKLKENILVVCQKELWPCVKNEKSVIIGSNKKLKKLL